MVLAQVSNDVEATTDEISDSARSVVETTVAALPRIGIALAVVLAGWGLSRLVRAVLHIVLRRRQTPSFALVMSKIGGWIVLAVATLGAIAVTFPSVKPVDLLAGLGFFSVAVGFAFQDILENTLAGVLLLFRQPFRSGDQIEVKDHSGTVQAITIRETRIRTFDGQLVLVPNRDVYKSVIRVQTHFELRRMEFMVGVAYENDAVEAARVIVEALGTVEGISPEPAPEALLSELSMSTVDLQVWFWTDPTQHESLTTLSRAIAVTKAHLDAAGIEMPAEIVVLQGTPSLRAALERRRRGDPGRGGPTPS